MRRALFIIVPVALLIAVYVGAWFVGAGVARERIDQWVEAQRAEGMEVDFGALHVGGFPVRFAAHASDLRVRAPDGLGWRGDALRAAVPVWNWSSVAVHIDDSLTATLPGRPPATLTTTGGDGRIDLDSGGGIRSARVDLNDLVVLVPGFEGVRIGSATVQLSPPETYADGSQRASLQLDLQQIALPADATPLSADPAFAAPIDALTTRLAPSAPPPEALRVPFLGAWRDRGGDLLVEDFAMAWGPLHVGATGQLALDAALQPRGQLRAEISGLPELIDSLQRSGALPDDLAQILRLGAAAAAAGGQDGSSGTVSTPVGIADGMLSLGPFPVTRLPAIAWPP